MSQLSGAAPASLHVVLPGSVDDPTVPSGGNRYDQRVCDGLVETGWRLRRLPVPGAWPWPEPEEVRALAGALAAVPDGELVLIDGLVGCAAPEPLVQHADRLRLVPLVHLPLADETGVSQAQAATLETTERRALATATGVLATSAWAGDRLVDRYGVPPERLWVAAPGVEPAPVTTGSRSGSRLLCVAALTPRKGHDLLVEALGELAELDFDCACVGDLRSPDQVARVRARVRELGLAERFRLLGPYAGAQLAERYAAADLLVLPSRAETYGMVVTEALARGIPVLATEVGGVPEALGRAGTGLLPGLLVPPEQPRALAGALRRWLTDPDLRARLREAAADRRRSLPGWESTVAAVAGALTRLAGTTGVAR